MSLFIKDVNIPKSGGLLIIIDADYNFVIVDDFTNNPRHLKNVVTEVLTPHGRLIDAYAFVSDLIFPNESFEQAFKAMVDDAPTVIEAEG